MRRRDLLALGLAMPAVTSLGDGQGSLRVGMTEVRELRDTIARLYGLDHQHGGEALWRAAVSSAESGYRLLEAGTYSAGVELQLIKTTSRAQMCAGWLAFDAGWQEVARHCYTEALAMARQTGDVVVESHALGNLAMQSSRLGQPREAVRYAEGAARAVRSGTTLSVVPHLRSAVALSLSQDATGETKAIKAPWRCIGCALPRQGSTAARSTGPRRQPSSRLTTSPVRWRVGAWSRRWRPSPNGCRNIPRRSGSWLVMPCIGGRIMPDEIVMERHDAAALERLRAYASRDGSYIRTMLRRKPPMPRGAGARSVR
jgi:hypothetical protein